jgi:hypothetical protein
MRFHRAAREFTVEADQQPPCELETHRVRIVRRGEGRRVTLQRQHGPLFGQIEPDQEQPPPIPMPHQNLGDPVMPLDSIRQPPHRSTDQGTRIR